MIGRFRLEIGVPGGTLTLKVRVWPPRIVTLIVQASAEALGSAEIAIVTRIAPVIASTSHNLRLLSNVDRLLRVISVCRSTAVLTA